MASAMYDGVYCTTALSTAATSVTSVTRGMICRLLFRGASGSEDASESEGEGERWRLRERRPRVRMGLVVSTSSGGSYGADDCMRERSICEKSSAEIFRSSPSRLPSVALSLLNITNQSRYCRSNPLVSGRSFGK